MKSSYTTKSTQAKKRIEGDQHRLVGQILDDRLRVISLNHTSPRQWLYQVEPPSVGKTRRALKVLGDPLAREPGSFYRLKTAYDRLKRVSSPYIERVYECGLLHDLTPYILVEWEPHQSLYEYLRLRRKPLSWREAHSLFLNLAKGLSALHEKGVAHGDLRPQHILLREPPQVPVIIDACINSAFGSPPVPGLEHSHAFWAPERRSLSTATASSDLYSLGAIMFYCLNGFPPFTLSSSGFLDQEDHRNIQSPIRCIEEAHQSIEPPSFQGDAPANIKELIHLLLAKTARLRPPINEVIKKLDTFQTVNSLDETQDLSAGELSKQVAEVINQATMSKSSPPSAQDQSVKPSSSVSETQVEHHTDTPLMPNPIQKVASPWLISALCTGGAILGIWLAKFSS